MAFSLCRAGTFIGCYIGCAVVGSVFVTASANLFAPVGVETTAFLIKLSVLAAVIPASLIAKHLNNIYVRRTARRLLEKEWERWMSQQCARKPGYAGKSNSGDKEAA